MKEMQVLMPEGHVQVQGDSKDDFFTHRASSKGIQQDFPASLEDREHSERFPLWMWGEQPVDLGEGQLVFELHPAVGLDCPNLLFPELAAVLTQFVLELPAHINNSMLE